jgi:hypothetical protein
MADDSRTDADGKVDRDEKQPPVGPTDQGGKGGMATREIAPDVAEPAVPEPPD